MAASLLRARLRRAWLAAMLAAGACVTLRQPTLVAQAARAAQTTPPAPRGGEVLIDRTVALVGGAVVTQAEVDLAVALGLVTMATPGPEAATRAVVDRWLMLHEVARFSPPEPDPASVEAKLEAVRARAGGSDALNAMLARAGFSPARLAAWVRDDLRITAYLDQRFASAGTPVDADVAGYVAAHRDELGRDGAGDAAIAAAARARLVAERRRELITDWLEDLRRRTEVVEFRRPGG